jgi:hypothetical protein
MPFRLLSSRPAAALAAALCAALLLSSAAGAAAPFGGVRRATARYHSLVQAERAGYGPFPAGVPLHECIAAFDGSGAMGIHWLNPGLLDTTLDEQRPEVLVYAPDARGKLRLAALEYVVFAAAWEAEHGSTAPTMFGQPMTFMPEGIRFEIPAFWQRHVWLWNANPDGVFADFNPSVSC